MLACRASWRRCALGPQYFLPDPSSLAVDGDLLPGAGPPGRVVGVLAASGGNSASARMEAADDGRHRGWLRMNRPAVPIGGGCEYRMWLCSALSWASRASGQAAGSRQGLKASLGSTACAIASMAESMSGSGTLPCNGGREVAKLLSSSPPFLNSARRLVRSSMSAAVALVGRPFPALLRLAVDRVVLFG